MLVDTARFYALVVDAPVRRGFCQSHRSRIRGPFCRAIHAAERGRCRCVLPASCMCLRKPGRFLRRFPRPAWGRAPPNVLSADDQAMQVYLGKLHPLPRMATAAQSPYHIRRGLAFCSGARLSNSPEPPAQGGSIVMTSPACVTVQCEVWPRVFMVSTQLAPDLLACFTTLVPVSSLW
jgi:hypothetical protein